MHYSTLMLALSVVAIVYGGLLALAQDDLKNPSPIPASATWAS